MSELSNQVITGGISGLTATAPMTMAMEMLHKRLPAGQRFELPPREIAARVAKKAGVLHSMDETMRRNLTLLSHFGYGAAMGAAYGATANRLPLPGAVKGSAFGLAVWGASYMGWLPVMRVLPPATRMSRHRNALMIAAHLVWGLTTAVVTQQLQESSANSLARRGRARADRAREGGGRGGRDDRGRDGMPDRNHARERLGRRASAALSR